MMACRKMICQMPWHGFAIVRHQYEVVLFAPEQNIRILSASLWSADITHRLDFQGRFQTEQMGAIVRRNMLVHQIADHDAFAMRAALCSAMRACSAAISAGIFSSNSFLARWVYSK